MKATPLATRLRRLASFVARHGLTNDDIVDVGVNQAEVHVQVLAVSIFDRVVYPVVPTVGFCEGYHRRVAYVDGVRVVCLTRPG